MYGVNSMGYIWFRGSILLGTLVVFGLCITWSVCGHRYRLIFMQTHILILCIAFGAYIRSDVKRAHIGYIVQGTYTANTMHLIYEIHCIGSMYQEHYVGSAYWVHYVGSTYWVHYSEHVVGTFCWEHILGTLHRPNLMSVGVVGTSSNGIGRSRLQEFIGNHQDCRVCCRCYQHQHHKFRSFNIKITDK